MNRKIAELTVGLFMLLGIGFLAFLSVRLGEVQLFGREGYMVNASFSNVGGLKEGAYVTVAGVQVGRVSGIRLEDYEGRVQMTIQPDVVLREDAMAAVKTRGLIGEKYVSLSPGGADKKLQDGDRIRDTQPAVDLESILSKYVFGEL